MTTKIYGNKLKTRGYLTFPSNEMVNLLKHLEKIIVRTCINNELEENLLFLIVDEIEKAEEVPLVGCESHKSDVTKLVIRFYIIMRMHFLCKRWNEKTAEQKKKQRKLRKAAHLT